MIAGAVAVDAAKRESMCINARMSTGMLGAQSVASKEAHHWHRPQPDSISLASAPPPLAQQEALLRQLTLRNKVHAIFDARGVAETLYAGRHQTLSNTVIATTLVAILVSVVLLILDGMPRYSVPDEPVMVLETICVGWFTLELTVRMVTVQDKLSFWKELLNWIDVIAILPYYIDLIIILSTERGRGGSPNGYLVLRVVRLARIFRLFKLTKYNSDLQLVGIAMSNSTDALSLLLFMTTIAGVLVASGVFFAEQVAATWDPRREEWVRKPEYGGTHEFQSIPHAFWFALATVSSVGYGDMVPVSPVVCTPTLRLSRKETLESIHFRFFIFHLFLSIRGHLGSCQEERHRATYPIHSEGTYINQTSHTRFVFF
ncbi:Potassium voltage-gated channel protein Shaker [Diplonema papillatum]|nr:Potassium voltage-gated channel protein Shaker [Diplonema papillatum]